MHINKCVVCGCDKGSSSSTHIKDSSFLFYCVTQKELIKCGICLKYEVCQGLVHLISLGDNHRTWQMIKERTSIKTKAPPAARLRGSRRVCWPSCVKRSVNRILSEQFVVIDKNTNLDGTSNVQGGISGRWLSTGELKRTALDDLFGRLWGGSRCGGWGRSLLSYRRS